VGFVILSTVFLSSQLLYLRLASIQNFLMRDYKPGGRVAIFPSVAGWLYSGISSRVDIMVVLPWLGLQEPHLLEQVAPG
jgi:hypothetical protein